MAEITFGFIAPGVQYTERRAAYVVILNQQEEVALVREGRKLFLPGGGAEEREAPEEAVRREVQEELGCGVRLNGRLGEYTQYFYASADERHYRMRAVIFTGEFTEEPGSAGEHRLEWLPIRHIERACYHACHAWAVRQALNA